jgi:hypothetical protein
MSKKGGKVDYLLGDGLAIASCAREDNIALVHVHDVAHSDHAKHVYWPL